MLRTFSTLVLTLDGNWVSLADVKVGDILLGDGYVKSKVLQINEVNKSDIADCWTITCGDLGNTMRHLELTDDTVIKTDAGWSVINSSEYYKDHQFPVSNIFEASQFVGPVGSGAISELKKPNSLGDNITYRELITSTGTYIVMPGVVIRTMETEK